MRYFEKDGKFNWVDESNRFVGFDSRDHCCERFGWRVLTSKPTGSEEGIEEVEPVPWDDYSFADEKPTALNGAHYEEGGEVSFRLVAQGRPDLFLSIFNHQNGYYSHGFDYGLGAVSGDGYL